MLRLKIRAIILILLNAIMYSILFMAFTSNVNNDNMRTNTRVQRPQRRREENIHD